MSTDLPEILPTSGKAIRLRIISEISLHGRSSSIGWELSDADEVSSDEPEHFPEDIEDAALQFLDRQKEENGTDDVMRIDQNTEGAFCERDGRVTISYDDSELTEGLPTLTQITYRPDEPHMIAILRSGAASSMYILEEGRRHVCEIKTAGMSLPVTFSARRVRNTVSDGIGDILLDYSTEISGAVTQHTIMKIELLPDPDGGDREFCP